jgi:AcrR family transcriptional regulator
MAADVALLVPGPAAGPAGADPGRPERAGAPVDGTVVRDRVLTAALGCVARAGVRRSTLDDVARAAGLSRATLYRHFPGGREAVLAALLERERDRFFAEVGAAMSDAPGLEEALAAGVRTAAGVLGAHAALAAVLDREPEVVQPALAFAGMDRLLALAVGRLAPRLGAWLGPAEAARATEWATRVVVSYLLCPAEGMDLSRPADAEALARGTLAAPFAARVTGGMDPGDPPPRLRSHRPKKQEEQP